MNEELTMTPESLLINAQALCLGEHDLICQLANLSALIKASYPQINWAGFYLLKEGELLLGPFQGKPACTHIALGQGVCGTAAQLRRTQRVADVHAFVGHIACDAQSRSEIVVPLIKRDTLLGVLDLDAPIPDYFSETDQQLLETLAGWISEQVFD